VAQASAPASQPVPQPAVVASPAKPASALAAAGRAASAPRREAAKPVLTEKAGDYRPVPKSPVFAAPEPAASTPGVLTTKSAVPASAASAAEPRSPTEACGRRVLLALAWCVDRQCEKPEFQNHPECVRLRDIRNSRQGGVP
ncbi:MAG TPA: hypothetical protein VK305_12810, partial [Roseateles sp.]|nr:hypothetical protein [Roseateles sp.]